MMGEYFEWENTWKQIRLPGNSAFYTIFVLYTHSFSFELCSCIKCALVIWATLIPLFQLTTSKYILAVQYSHNTKNSSRKSCVLSTPHHNVMENPDSFFNILLFGLPHVFILLHILSVEGFLHVCVTWHRLFWDLAEPKQERQKSTEGLSSKYGISMRIVAYRGFWRLAIGNRDASHLY